MLELCAGEGRNGVWLAARGFAVTSVDGSAVGLAKASALAAERKTSLRTVVSDLAAYDVAAEPWDVIVSIFAHLPPPLRQRVHAAAVQALTPGGIFLLEAYTPAQVARGVILANEVSRQARGASSGSGAVAQLIATGKMDPPELKGRYLPGLLAGDSVFAVAIDEGPKHRPERIATRAQRAGNGFSISGAMP
ncbi:MAG TPA: methyltransferase domain-containing protein, partial [Kofleriaceae bacterium]|nr:methyltransferase domain-containing protein [Kofleriaceae bacterium]